MATTDTAAAAPTTSADPRRWWALITVSLGLFMALLDVTIVNVALPTIGDDLNTSFADLQWVVSAYTLALAVFLVTAGRLGDLFGRKRLFVVGLGVFALGSMLCALSGDFTLFNLTHIQTLIAARAIQGLGGAIMLPLSLAILSSTFHGRERGVAFGVYGGVTGLATAIGPVLGGLLVEKVNWQSIFWINVPIGIIAIALCLWSVQESYDTTAPRSIDVFGLVTLSAALFCLVLALIQGNDANKGWTSPYILTLFGIAALGLVAFIIGELLLKNPMVDPHLFKNASFTGVAIVAFTLSAGLYSLFFFLTLYLQNYLGFSPLQAGLRALPLSGLVLLTAPLAGAQMHRFGPKVFLVLGMALMAVGVLLMTRITTDLSQTAWLVLLPGFILAGLGSGMVNPPIADVAVSTVSRDRAGMASGVSSVCRQLGTAFGIAFFGAILTSRYNGRVSDGVKALSVPGVPESQAKAILDGIVTGLQNAGTFAASTGLRNLPPQFQQFANSPLFPQIQHIVQSAYIASTVEIFQLGAILLAIGALAALLLVKRSDMRPATEGAEYEAAPLEF
jgi:EmrB/QacA subfamily drug resistance transporter